MDVAAFLSHLERLPDYQGQMVHLEDVPPGRPVRERWTSHWTSHYSRLSKGWASSTCILIRRRLSRPFGRART